MAEEDLRVRPGVVIPGGDLEVRVARASGPGGQGVNTTDSAVELRFDVAATAALDSRQKARVREHLGGRITKDGVLVLRASEYRSQLRNREEARRRLVRLLAEALEPRMPRRPTKPSAGARRRRMDTKRRRGEVKRLRRGPDPD